MGFRVTKAQMAEQTASCVQVIRAQRRDLHSDGRRQDKCDWSPFNVLQ